MVEKRNAHHLRGFLQTPRQLDASRLGLRSPEGILSRSVCGACSSKDRQDAKREKSAGPDRSMQLLASSCQLLAVRTPSSRPT